MTSLYLLTSNSLKETDKPRLTECIHVPGLALGILHIAFISNSYLTLVQMVINTPLLHMKKERLRQDKQLPRSQSYVPVLGFAPDSGAKWNANHFPLCHNDSMS